MCQNRVKFNYTYVISDRLGSFIRIFVSATYAVDNERISLLWHLEIFQNVQIMFFFF